MIANPRRRGFALVVIMVTLVLLTVLVLAFFSRAQLNRQVAFSSTNMARAEALARTGLDIVVGELRQEIVEGSVELDGGNANFPVVYEPIAATNAVPTKIGVISPDSIGGRTLVKVSSAGLALRPQGTNTASAVLTSTRSLNGRYLSAERWFGSSGPGLGSQAGLPSWFYLTREGGIRTPAVVDAKNRASADYVVGRFACTVYDVSGLLNANVAGYPAIAATNAPLKSSTAFADLTALGTDMTTSLVENFITWRNGTDDTASSSDYQSFLTDFAMQRGFQQCQLGHNAFVSRKDLLNSTRSGLLPESAAVSFSHFSSAVNAPGWGASENSDKLSGYIGGDGTTLNAYRDDANSPASANRFFPNVRHTDAATITRYSDQGAAQTYSVAAGDPLVKHRFSLAKLSWLGYGGPKSGISDAAIAMAFGLEWNSGAARWDYTALTPGKRIATLAEVAEQQREPNFFELLKAAILGGSLGRDPGAIIETGAFPANKNYWEGVCGDGFEIYSAAVDRHIAQLAANIIDQADEDGYPTTIHIPLSPDPTLPEHEPVNLCQGIENLPYLHKIQYVALGYDGLNAAGGPARYAGWLQPELWNPHRAAVSGGGARPTQFRVKASGQAYIFYSTSANPSVQSPPLDFNTAATASVYFGDSGGTSSAFYAQPQVLNTTNADTTTTAPVNIWQSSYADLITDSTLTFGPDNATSLNQFVGIRVGDMAFDQPNTNSNNPKHRIIPSPMITFQIEYRDASGVYRPYSYLSRLRSYYYADRPTVGSSKPKISYLRPDPRTDRFSAGISSGGASSNVPINETYQPGPSKRLRSAIGWAQVSSGFTYNKSDGNPFINQKYLGDWMVNLASDETFYADPDGVNRPGDGFRQDSSTGDGFLLFHASSDPASESRRRPIILDRPFETVAELGYTFRDTPFKSLDFYSPDSADGALLDVFSVTEEPDQTAGKLNPGSASQAVLSAVLQGAGKDAFDVSLTLSSSESTNLAATLVGQTTTNPLLNQADLAGPLADAINQALSDPADKANKTRGEAPVRALAAVSQVRTWNLLIDLVAQVGRLPETAANLGNFVVEGERRYWLHVAIDRTTGKIVSRQLEPVYE